MPRRRGRDGGLTPPKEPTMTPTELAVEAVAARAVTVRKDGRTLEISIQDAVMERLAQEALKGGAHAMRQFIALNAEAEEKRRAIVTEDIWAWTLYKKQQSALIKAALDKGDPEPEMLPHPEDVIIDPIKGVSFDGPFLEEELWRARETQHLIKAILLQEALDLRRDRVKKAPRPVPGCPLVFALWFNRTFLGKRMRFTNEEMIDMRMRFRGLSIRTLEGRTYQAWKAAKIPTPRGSRGWSNREMLQIMQFGCKGAAILCDETLSRAARNEQNERLIDQLFG